MKALINLSLPLLLIVLTASVNTEVANAGSYVSMSMEDLVLMSDQEFGRLEGRVYDSESGRTLPGANVLIQGTSIGTSTDDNGRFVLRRVPAGNQTIRVSFIGFEVTTVE